MKKQIKTIYLGLDLIAKKLAQIVIRLYQWTFSPDKSPFFRHWLGGRVCRHHPHCSQYGYECFDYYNFFTASYRTMDRISRCTPGLSRSYDPVRYRVVFASGSPIGVPFLEALAADPRYDVVGVLTMPDMPSGRGMKMQENVIAITAQQFVIPTVVEESFISTDKRSLPDMQVKDDKIEMTKEHFIKKPHSLRLDSKKYADDAQDTYTWLQSLDVDILYVVAYGNLIPQYILDIPKIAPINIHGSLLPAYRGASPLQTVFLDGLTETGVTLMKMEAGLDSGPMIDKQIFKLGFSDTVADLIQRVKESTPKWSLDSIDNYVHGALEEETQEELLVTHCGKIEKEDGLLDIENDTIEHIYRKYKAYYLWPKIFMKLDTKNTEQKIVTIDNLVIEESLYDIHKEDGLFIDDTYTLNPAITHLHVKPEGGKSMSRDDFLRGYMKS